MALREFTDSDGLHWPAWDVHPSRNYDNFLAGLREPTPIDAPAWLAFECRSTGERRRLDPAPRDWSVRANVELTGLCGCAERLPDRRKRRIE